MTPRIITADEGTASPTCDPVSPDYAREILREIDIGSNVKSNDIADLCDTVIAQTAELASLRAIIDGRTTPPTVEQIEAHHRAGGSWYVASTHGRALTTTRGDAIALCGHLAANGYPATWWAISVRGRPCAWPVVAEVSP
jgi:hypothetical protein